ncbi:2-C-methyl-D-erythritol 4-phosphate cytidylyltransferase [Halobacteroides halobius DSM 5150]|uniref:2-C-methyl-D-erythritol 4-phosphate cytidylyltransferase n=1 Tax=Halobacteroides halobius (strain ATCC 35273 / DSM 5150 / MD-1) TaxID=748449 RepID=L0K7S3_HALHC|nr:2-C-methyl-D-erythritol 4-phosphate cytidylyltransferase [Halobacteroides halobius]AGB40173.1 2-C-methyl-D-erythritol 4-phosphate cytidylyltransferase [Halobacteroides halobius DSM 5150]
MKVSVVIPAAGQGKRMKADKNKQFLLLDGMPILAHTIDKFEQVDLIEEIIVVAQKDEIDYCKNKIIDEYNFTKVNKIITGGATRQESVYNGLQAVSQDTDYILTHDGARPLLTTELIRHIITKVKQYKAVLTAVPVKDTIKVVNQDEMVINTPDRSKLVAVQTPQAFVKDLIIKAYQQAAKNNIVGTDSASLVENLGKSVKVIRGSYENIKVTTPEDLEVAEKIVIRRKE